MKKTKQNKIWYIFVLYLPKRPLLVFLRKHWLSGWDNLKNCMASGNKSTFLCPTLIVETFMERLLKRRSTWPQILQKVSWLLCWKHIQTFMIITPSPYWKPKWSPFISNSSTHKCLVLVHHNILLHLSYTVGFSLIRNITFSAVKFWCLLELCLSFTCL